MQRDKTMNETGSAVAARRRARGEPAKAAPKAAADAAVLATAETRALLSALIALKQGDSSVRLPVEWAGLHGKLAETFNEVVELNERMAEELSRLRQKVGKEGKLKQRADIGDVRGFWRHSIELRERPHRRPRPPDLRDGARDRRGRPGRPLADHGARGRRPPAGRRVPAHREDHQQDGGPARLVRLRSDARGARGGHRGQAGRPGEGEGRGGHVEGPDRLGELHGRQPHRPGAQHRRGDDGGGDGRPLEEDHGGREGRGAGAEEHHQHDGGPAPVVRIGSDARGARGGHGRQARRPGGGGGRVGNLEGPDRFRELHGRRTSRARCATSRT